MFIQSYAFCVLLKEKSALLCNALQGHKGFVTRHRRLTKPYWQARGTKPSWGVLTFNALPCRWQQETGLALLDIGLILGKTGLFEKNDRRARS
jgi:hypothetical protein